MIYHVASLEVVPGKGNEAKQALSKAGEYISKKSPDSNPQILQGIDGSSNRIHGIESYDSLATWEAVVDARGADPEWQDIISELMEVTVGTDHHFYRVVS